MAKSNMFQSKSLAELLEKKGWSYQKLADRINDVAFKLGHEETNVRPSNISSWVTKGVDISGTYLFLLSVVLAIPMEHFFPKIDESIKPKE